VGDEAARADGAEGPARPGGSLPAAGDGAPEPTLVAPSVAALVLGV
jgi:hypothetical protein